MNLLLIVLFILALAGAYVLYLKRKPPRTKMLAQAAKRLNLDFNSQRYYISGQRSFHHDPFAGLPLDQLSAFELFHRGEAKWVENVLSGLIDGYRVLIFDYSFQHGYAGPQIVTQTVLLVISQSLQLPDFSLKPEGTLQKAQIRFGVQDDIVLDKFPLFSKSYLLQGSDSEMIRALFTEPLIRFYEARRDRFICTEGSKSLFLYFEKGRAQPADQIDAFAEEGLKALDRFSGKIVL